MVQSFLINAHSGHIPLPDGSVHMVVTSPPFWGLRDYNLPPLVWGGEPQCPHLWSNQIITDTRGTQIGKAVIVDARESTRGQFCQRCGAWSGSLGLEPTPELYVEHIVEIFREVKRVLRADGTVWLNLASSYCSGIIESGEYVLRDDLTPEEKEYAYSELANHLKAKSEALSKMRKADAQTERAMP